MAPDWRSLVLEIEPKARMTAPATEAEIADTEQAVGCQFPADLRRLYQQTNGVMDDLFGPLLPLSGKHLSLFTDQFGNVVAQTPFPATGRSVVDSTLETRSDELARGNEWGGETRALLSTFVVLGMDAGGNMFGFLAGLAETVEIRYIEHDTAEVDDTIYTLEEYLRFYFEDCRWFNDEE